MVETRTHDIIALVSGFHIWINTLSDEDRRFWNEGPKCDLEAAGRRFKLSAFLYWRSSYGLLGTRVYRAQEGEVARDFAIKFARSMKKRRPEAVNIGLGHYLWELVEGRNFRAQHNVGDSNTYHLPSVLFSEDIQELRSSFRELVPDSEYENTDIMKAFRDIFQVIHFLWQETIAHHDISVGNFMFRVAAKGEFVCCVLNDWDLAKVDDVLNKSVFRTGTRAKLVLFHERPKLKSFKLLHRYWIHPWTVLYQNGFQERDDRRCPWDTTPTSTSFEDETLGGHVTFKKIWDILKQDLVEDNSYH